ncbi:MAG: aminopeptidase P family protein, partial [Gemmatimonadetes bacterium]|nr:aminopeptidase P family protein [Gemmatimonadota bacterium]
MQAPQEAGTVADVQVERASVWGRVRGLLRERGWGRIGFEGHLLPAREADRLRGELSGSLVDAGEVVEGLRQVKDADEVAAIRAAATLAQDALAEVLPTVRVGERELDLASRLEAALRRRGSEWHPFETIVASGPRSALPHARTTERRLAAGDLLLIDFGAKVGGYCADLTRMAVLGPADEQQRTVHALVA